jgi:acetoin utilization protein AcuB
MKVMDVSVQDPERTRSIEPASIKISSIMKSPVITIGMDETLNSALELCNSRKIRHLPVVDENDRLAGILTDRDIRFNLSPRLGTLSENNSDRSNLQRPVHLLMGRKIITGTPDMSIAVAAKTMLHHRVGCLPILDGDRRVVGIATESDFLILIAASASAKQTIPRP